MSPVHARAFDRRTGRTVWEQNGDWAFTRSDLVRLDSVVVGRNDDGELIALVAATGRPLWRVSHRGRRFPPDVAESPAVVDGDVVFSAPDGAIYRVGGGDGSVTWRRDVGCDVSTSITAGDENIYFGCSDGTLFQLSAADGQERRRLSLGHSLEGRLLFASDRLIVPGGGAWIGAVTPDLGRMPWERTDLPRLSVVQPVQWDDVVLTGARGRLMALALSDGRGVWSVALDGDVRGLGTAGDILLVGTIQGRVHALRGLP